MSGSRVTLMQHWQPWWYHGHVIEGCHKFLALALAMLLPCQSGQDIGGGCVTGGWWHSCHISWLLGRCGTDSLGLRLGESCTGRQGLLTVMEGVLCFLFLLVLIASALDKDTTRSWYVPVLTLLHHSARECCGTVQGHWPKDKKAHIASVCTMSQSYRQLERPHSCEQSSTPSTFSVSCNDLIKQTNKKSQLEKEEYITQMKLIFLSFSPLCKEWPGFPRLYSSILNILGVSALFWRSGSFAVLLRRNINSLVTFGNLGWSLKNF